MQFNAREASMIRFALREQAKEYRKMAKRRSFIGPQYADLRARARREAGDYERLADTVVSEREIS